MKTQIEKKKVIRLNNQQGSSLSKECLRDALLQLMCEKKLEDITIIEIVSKAGVSRMAFYRNYKDKDNLLEDISKTLLKDMNQFYQERFDEKESFKAFKSFFSCLVDNRRFIEIIVRIIEKQNRSIFAFPSLLNILHPNNSLQIYGVEALEKGMNAIIYTWIKNGMKESPKEMAQICQQIFQDIIEKIFSSKQ